MVTDERRSECEQLRTAIRRWAEIRSDVRAVAILGSWARKEPTMDSDLDLVVLTDRKADYLNSDQWIEEAVGERAAVIRAMDWGPLLSERRLRLASSFEVEFGFAPLCWAEVGPVDAGTAEVVRDGCIALHDPDGVVERLLRAIA